MIDRHVLMCSHPEQFACKITSRSLESKDMILEAVREEAADESDARHLDRRIREEYGSGGEAPRESAGR